MGGFGFRVVYYKVFVWFVFLEFKLVCWDVVFEGYVWEVDEFIFVDSDFIGEGYFWFVYFGC